MDIRIFSYKRRIYKIAFAISINIHQYLNISSVYILACYFPRSILHYFIKWRSNLGYELNLEHETSGFLVRVNKIFKTKIIWKIMQQVINTHLYLQYLQYLKRWNFWITQFFKIDIISLQHFSLRTKYVLIGYNSTDILSSWK